MARLTKARKTWLAKRRKLHRMARTDADLTMEGFSRMVGYSRYHVTEVLYGRRDSAAVDAVVARFINRRLGVTL